ncbi:MAG: hypothetical protein GOV15_04500 [Candidatus Diapherotrites archaeon]|nr:hypothetical protein [Candidatus Diapherotrites archaeon]
MSNRKNQAFKEYLGKRAHSAKQAPVWVIQKAGQNVRKYKQGFKHWRKTDLGNAFKGKKR